MEHAISIGRHFSGISNYSSRGSVVSVGSSVSRGQSKDLQGLQFLNSDDMDYSVNGNSTVGNDTHTSTFASATSSPFHYVVSLQKAA